MDISKKSKLKIVISLGTKKNYCSFNVNDSLNSIYSRCFVYISIQVASVECRYLQNINKIDTNHQRKSYLINAEHQAVLVPFPKGVPYIRLQFLLSVTFAITI